MFNDFIMSVDPQAKNRVWNKHWLQQAEDKSDSLLNNSHIM